MPVILALRRLEKEDGNFEASLDYTIRCCLNKTKQKTRPKQNKQSKTTFGSVDLVSFSKQRAKRSKTAARWHDLALSEAQKGVHCQALTNAEVTIGSFSAPNCRSKAC
jgi:hypothetical protein